MAVSAETEHFIARAVFVVSLLATAALYALPDLRPFAYPLLLLSTLVHELGHGVAALAAGGHFESFQLWPDGSGEALTSGVGTAMGRAVVAAGGLVGPAFAAALAFWAGRKPGTARWFTGLLGLLTWVAMVRVVRNPFGWFFVGAFALLFTFLSFKAAGRWPQIVLVFLGTQLALSVYSRSDYLFTPVVHSREGTLPSDVSAIAEALAAPYWFWGAIAAAISVVVLWWGARTLWRKAA